MQIKRKVGLGTVQAWIDNDELYIRESVGKGKGREVATVCLSYAELAKVNKFVGEQLIANDRIAATILPVEVRRGDERTPEIVAAALLKVEGK